MSAELVHEVSVKKGFFMRQFIRTYEVNSSDTITTCHLFWGFLFLPLTIWLFPIVEKLLLASQARQIKKNQRKVEAELRHSYYEANAEMADEPSARSSWLEGISTFMAKVWWKVQPALPYVGGTIAAALVIGVVILFVLFPLPILTFLLHIAITLAALALVALVLYGVIVLIGKLRIGKTIRKVGGSVHRHTCAVVKIEDK